MILHNIDIKDIEIKNIEIIEYQIPFKTPLVFGGKPMKTRRGFYIKLTDTHNHTGLGEAAPLEGYSPDTIAEARQQLLNLSKHPLEQNLTPSVRFGLETALIRITEQITQKPFQELVSQNPKKEIRINALLHTNTINTINIENVEQEVKTLINQGFESIKIKVARQSLEKDIETINRVTALLPKNVSLRLDANGLWDFNTALEFGKNINPNPIEYLEEPFKDSDKIPEFHLQTSIPIALDESLTETNPQDFTPPQGVTALILKPTLLGGIKICLEFITLSKEKNLTPIISSCFETPPGHHMLTQLAASIDFTNTPSGLDTLKYIY